MASSASHSNGSSTEFNLVEIWLRKDPARWMAGAFAGIFAALAMFAATLVCAKMHHTDPWFLIKAFAVPCFGGVAMEEGNHLKMILTGAMTLGLLSTLLGVVYAHMTGTNRLSALFGVGITWGAFSWIFIGNLFSPAFRETVALNFSRGASFVVFMIFGISLMSVAFFDRMFRSVRP